MVELVALEDAEIKYSTVQNWYPGDSEGKGGIYNFVTKRADCRGPRSKVSWTQVETGSAITWKYPSCILRGDGSVGEFHSVALANHRQQARPRIAHPDRKLPIRMQRRITVVGNSYDDRIDLSALGRSWCPTEST